MLELLNKRQLKNTQRILKIYDPMSLITILLKRERMKLKEYQLDAP